MPASGSHFSCRADWLRTLACVLGTINEHKRTECVDQHWQQRAWWHDAFQFVDGHAGAQPRLRYNSERTHHIFSCASQVTAHQNTSSWSLLLLPSLARTSSHVATSVLLVTVEVVLLQVYSALERATSLRDSGVQLDSGVQSDFGV